MIGVMSSHEMNVQDTRNYRGVNNSDKYRVRPQIVITVISISSCEGTITLMGHEGLLGPLHVRETMMTLSINRIVSESCVVVFLVATTIRDYSPSDVHAELALPLRNGNVYTVLGDNRLVPPLRLLAKLARYGVRRVLLVLVRGPIIPILRGRFRNVLSIDLSLLPIGGGARTITEDSDTCNCNV